MKVILCISFQSGTVRVDVYYEVLCPDSRYFVLHQLYPTFQKIGEAMDIHYVPYGKATVSHNGNCTRIAHYLTLFVPA